jgi:hypothetical protein
MTAPTPGTLAACSYAGSVSCIALSFLNEYAAAIGVIVAVLTFITSLVFQILKYKQDKKLRDTKKE